MVRNCTADFIEQKKLNEYERIEMAATERVAAVLLPIVKGPDECSVIFTKRVRDLNHHGGEVSFPGGVMEAGDFDLTFTALRETHEEIGVAPNDVRILGMMDDELSKWGGHRVTPIVGLISKPEFVLQETEVEKLYQVPVSHLLDPGVYYSENWTRDKETREVHFFYRYNNDIIWGLTARILKDFLDYMSR